MLIWWPTKPCSLPISRAATDAYRWFQPPRTVLGAEWRKECASASTSLHSLEHEVHQAWNSPYVAACALAPRIPNVSEGFQSPDRC